MPDIPRIHLFFLRFKRTHEHCIIRKGSELGVSASEHVSELLPVSHWNILRRPIAIHELFNPVQGDEIEKEVAECAEDFPAGYRGVENLPVLFCIRHRQVAAKNRNDLETQEVLKGFIDTVPGLAGVKIALNTLLNIEIQVFAEVIAGLFTDLAEGMDVFLKEKAQITDAVPEPFNGVLQGGGKRGGSQIPLREVGGFLYVGLKFSKGDPAACKPFPAVGQRV